jgi:ribonuclease BN (tRNA processing enzyme)
MVLMTQTSDSDHELPPELVFLGTSGGIPVPIFFWSRSVCGAARHHPEHRRTRAVAALIGQEIILVDAGPDLEVQLDRESIKQVDRVFGTHWHYDHVWGLGALENVSFASESHLFELYVPYQVVCHFEQSCATVTNSINLHPVGSGDRIELPDATWGAEECNQTDHSIGCVVESVQTVAHLVGGVAPPVTVDTLSSVDLLNLEATPVYPTQRDPHTKQAFQGW